eukprot:TRINITY_DN22758_c0_g1_i1.p1 TRINITY_DN22758_c0_g1~~TRINITY_DN22758_c0_g1_i1.p1  ORF type:complete len:569 (+),score=87.55 TRINITY_DN22758_c0_g1_i1:57-1763(+)
MINDDTLDDESFTARWLPGRVKTACQKDMLLWWTVAAVVGGVSIGMALIPAHMPRWTNEILAIPGNLFLRMLKLLVLPLVTGSIMGGIMSLRRMGSGEEVKSLAKRTLLLYLLTYCIAIATGLVLVSIIRPGGSVSLQAEDNSDSDRWQCVMVNSSKSEIESTSEKEKDKTIVDSFTKVLYSAVPTNLFKAAAENNILGLITFAIALAAALPVNTGTQPLSGAEKAVTGFNTAITKIVNQVLKVSPICIFSLIAAKITAACNVVDMFSALGKFIGTVLLGLLLHGFVWLPLVYKLLAKESPLEFFRKFSRSLLTALAISSSAATLPVTVTCAVEKGIRPDLANFVLVLGATVNMDGTAMYEAVCAIFIAQLHGVEMSVAKMVIVAVTGSLAAMGAAAIPSAGLVTLVMVLQAVDLEEYAEDIAFILVVDWFLDRVRTAVNVLGDGMAVCIMQRLMKQEEIEDPVPPLPHSHPILSSRIVDGTFLYEQGDIVSAQTSTGVVSGALIHSRRFTDSTPYYTIHSPSGPCLTDWHSDWILPDPSLVPRLHSLESSTKPDIDKCNPLMPQIAQ